jgi:hypothetical protein
LERLDAIVKDEIAKRRSEFWTPRVTKTKIIETLIEGRFKILDDAFRQKLEGKAKFTPKSKKEDKHGAHHKKLVTKKGKR